MPGRTMSKARSGRVIAARRVGQVRDLEVHPLVAGLVAHVGKPPRLKVVDGVVGVVAVRQMRHDAAQPDRLVGRGAAQRRQHRRDSRRR